MKRHRLYIISLVVSTMLLSACHREHIPDNVVDTATFANFLTDAYLVEGYNYAVIRNNPDSLGEQLDKAYTSLYNKYNITPATYDSTMNYYISRPQILEDIYSRVLSRLQRIKDTTPSNPALYEKTENIELPL